MQQIPSTLAEALTNTERIQVVTERDAPFTIVHVNAAWCRASQCRHIGWRLLFWSAGPLVLSVGGAQPTGAADDPTVSATVDIDATAELATCA